MPVAHPQAAPGDHRVGGGCPRNPDPPPSGTSRPPIRCATRGTGGSRRIAGPCGLVIFGVTGDLARKKLMPAVYDLANRGLLPPGFSLVGFARRDWEDEDFAQVSYEAVKEHARTPFREEVWQQLAEGLRFVPGEFDDDDAFDRLTRASTGHRPRARHRRQLRVLPVGPAEVLPAGGPAAQAVGPVRPAATAGAGW